MRIIGIDPGTGIMGFGVIDCENHRHPAIVDAGVIATPSHTRLKTRLLDIYNSLDEIITDTHPDVMSIEKLFFARNITTAISVAEARGVVILVAAQHDLPVFEYTPLQIKQTLTGYGRADKRQIQQMVKLHLKIPHVIKPDDAADALAAAITHRLMTRDGLTQEKDLQL